MSEKLLIINADDFGFTEGVNEGILRGHTEGVITSTSVMARGEAAAGAERLNQYPELSVGLHFQIGDKNLEKRCRQGERFSNEEIRQLAEDFADQLRIFKDLTGGNPTHIDGHYSVHIHPDISPFIERFCTESGTPRRDTDAKLIKDFFGRDEHGNSDVARVSVDALLRILDQLEDGTNELMCHPGLLDEDLQRRTGYTNEREVELATLTNERVLTRLDQPDISLINWADVHSK